MNDQDRKTAIRLKSALDDVGVRIRLTQAYDLVAAARGLRNRELLKRSHVLPETADTELLAKVATRIDIGRTDEIVRVSAAIALPGMLTCRLGNHYMSASFEIAMEELSDVEAFMSGPRGDRGIKAMSQGMYHSRYYLDRSDRGLDLNSGNELAEGLLAIEDPSDRLDELEKAYGKPKHVEESIDEQRSEIRSILTALEDLAEEAGAEFDRSEWRDRIEQEIAYHLEEDDDSSVEDMIQDNDRGELVFVFAPPTSYLPDAMVTSEYRSSKPEDINPDRFLQFALARLGYTIGEFRRFSGNVKEGDADLDHSIVPGPRALVTPGELLGLLDNAGDSYFHIGLYAQVRISEINDLDTRKPIVLRNVHVCAHGPINGTHFDGPLIDEIVVSPEDGVLIAASSSPSDICGYVNSYFHGSAANVEEATGQPDNVVEVDFGQSDQYRLAFAA